MIIFLYGSDSYRRRKKLNEVVGEYQRKHSNLTLERFDLNKNNDENNDEFLRLREFCFNRSLFTDKKMAVIEGVLEHAKSAPPPSIIEFLKSNLKNKDATLLISGNESPPEKFSFLIEKPVQSQEFENLEGERLKFFIRKEARSRNINLTPQAINFLAENFKENSWGLITELDKISLVGSQSIDISDLQKIGDFSESPDIFNFIGLFLRGYPSKRAALKNLELLFIFHEEPRKIFNILASMSRSQQLVNRLAGYDVSVKSGKMDYEEALLDLALS